MSTQKRNTKPRAVVERPDESYNDLEPQELQKLLGEISQLSSRDLALAMKAISDGLIRQRDAATYRAVDFECAVANCAMEPNITPKKWQFILDEFILPHMSVLRVPSLPDWISKRAKGQLATRTKEDYPAASQKER